MPATSPRGTLRLAAVTAAAMLAMLIPMSGKAEAVDLGFWLYDVNRDGLVDSTAVDYNANGWYDQNFVDFNQADTRPGDGWLIDQNENGVIDEIAFDLTGDQVPDVWFTDKNEDNQLEQTYVAGATSTGGQTLPNGVVVPPPASGGGTTLVISPPKFGDLQDVAAGLQAGQQTPCQPYTCTLSDGWTCRMG